jgi:ParB family chromosome partitioning protein
MASSKSKRGDVPLPFTTIGQSGVIGWAPEEEELTGLDIQEVSIELIDDSPFQSREDMNEEEFAELVHSIQHEGFSGVLVVRQHPERKGAYQLVAGGHRRRDAARAAGHTTLPVMVVEASDKAVGLRTAHENLTRSDLNVVEEGQLYLTLRRHFSLTQAELATELKKSRDRIQACEDAAQSPLDIQEMLKKGMGLRAAKYLRRLPGAQDRAPIIAEILQGNLTADGVRQAVEQVEARLQSAATQLPIEEKPIGYSNNQGAQPHSTATELPTTSTTQDGARPEKEQVAETVSGSSPVMASPGEPVHEEQRQRHTSAPVLSSTRIHVDVPSSPTDTLSLVERAGRIHDIVQRLRRYYRLIGTASPSQEERATLQTIAELVEELLQRS